MRVSEYVLIDVLPHGLSTVLYKNFDENGVDISSGETQKIALARAVYKDAPFMILNEHTAALDPAAEFEVYNKMNTMAGCKTTIFILHRLSFSLFCQNIAVFHAGRLIQRGSYDVLVNDKSRMYYKLWRAQTRYYETENESS